MRRYARDPDADRNDEPTILRATTDTSAITAIRALTVTATRCSAAFRAFEEPTGAPWAPMISPSHMTRRPRTMVPTTQPFDALAVVWRPPGAARHLRMRDGFFAFHVDDGDVCVVADGDAPLAADAEQPLRTVARQIDEALDGEAAGVDVVEHDGNQRLHAGHARMRGGIWVVFLLARMRRVVGAETSTTPEAARPDRLRDGAHRVPAGSSARRCRAARNNRAPPASDDAASPRPLAQSLWSARKAISAAVEMCRTCTRRSYFSASRTSRRVEMIAASSSRHSGCEAGSPGRRCAVARFSRASSSEWKAARRLSRDDAVERDFIVNEEIAGRGAHEHLDSNT